MIDADEKLCGACMAAGGYCRDHDPMASVREHGVMTPNMDLLRAALGLREGKHSADSVARIALERLERLARQRDEDGARWTDSALVVAQIANAIPREYGGGNMAEMIRRMAADLAETREKLAAAYEDDHRNAERVHEMEGHLEACARAGCPSAIEKCRPQPMTHRCGHCGLEKSDYAPAGSVLPPCTVASDHAWDEIPIRDPAWRALGEICTALGVETIGEAIRVAKASGRIEEHS